MVLFLCMRSLWRLAFIYSFIFPSIDFQYSLFNLFICSFINSPLHLQFFKLFYPWLITLLTGLQLYFQAFSIAEHSSGIFSDNVSTNITFVAILLSVFLILVATGSVYQFIYRRYIVKGRWKSRSSQEGWFCTACINRMKNAEENVTFSCYIELGSTHIPTLIPIHSINPPIVECLIFYLFANK